MRGYFEGTIFLNYFQLYFPLPLFSLSQSYSLLANHLTVIKSSSAESTMPLQVPQPNVCLSSDKK